MFDTVEKTSVLERRMKKEQENQTPLEQKRSYTIYGAKKKSCVREKMQSIDLVDNPRIISIEGCYRA